MQLIGAVLPWLTSGAAGSDDDGAALRRALSAALREAGRRDSRIAAAPHVFVDLASLRPAGGDGDTAWRGTPPADDALLVTVTSMVAAQGSLMVRFLLRRGGRRDSAATEATVVLFRVQGRWVPEKTMVRPFH